MTGGDLIVLVLVSWPARQGGGGGLTGITTAYRAGTEGAWKLGGGVAAWFRGLLSTYYVEGLCSL